MIKAMTSETPGKVMALVGTAVASMMFLFLVSSTNASFESTLAQTPMPRIALFETLERSADVAVAQVTFAIQTFFVEPSLAAAETYGNALASAWSTSTDTVAFAMGVDETAQPIQAQAAKPEGRVAGATTEQKSESVVNGFSIDTLYSVLIR